MKFLVAFAAIVAVAVAGPFHRGLVLPAPAGPAPIVDENGSPISIAPALIDFSPVSGPGFVEPVQPSPVVIGEIPAGATPLVQIIVNVNQPESVPTVVAPESVVEGIVVPGPVNVVESPDVSHVVVEPVQVVNPMLPAPGPVEPVQVVSPVVIEPIAIGTPIIPAPAVVLPEILN